MTLLGIDIGGTAVKMGLLDGQGNILRQTEARVDFDGYKTPILETVLAAAQAFLAGDAIEGIGVSATGQIDADAGMVIGTCGNLPGWIGTPIQAALEAQFHVPVTVMNDANCALLGEHWRGSAQEASDVVMVTLGTGVGGGVFCGGQLLTGSRGLAGELGHMAYQADGLPCTCGNKGCWEQYASVTALLRIARDAMGTSISDGRDFFAKVQAQNVSAQAVLQIWTQHVAAGLVGLVHLLNPSLVIIGGGVSHQETLFIEPLRAQVMESVMPRYRDGLQIKAAQLGNTAGMIGAVRHWLDSH